MSFSVQCGCKLESGTVLFIDEARSPGSDLGKHGSGGTQELAGPFGFPGLFLVLLDPGRGSLTVEGDGAADEFTVDLFPNEIGPKEVESGADRSAPRLIQHLRNEGCGEDKRLQGVDMVMQGIPLPEVIAPVTRLPGVIGTGGIRPPSGGLLKIIDHLSGE